MLVMGTLLWHSDDDFATLFQNLFSHVRVKDVSVHDQLEQGLASSLLGNLSPVALDELSFLQSLLFGVSLSNRPDDRRCFAVGPDGRLQSKCLLLAFTAGPISLAGIKLHLEQLRPTQSQILHLAGIPRSPLEPEQPLQEEDCPRGYL